MKLHVIKPSVNNMTVRVFVRAAGIDVEEVDAYGQTRSEAFLRICPAHVTPLLEGPEVPGGALWESCAIMQYLCNANGLDKLYPTEPAARANQDSAMLYHTGSLYPMVARAAYPVLGFPLYPGEVGASDADDAAKEKARKGAEDALAEMLDVFMTCYAGDGVFIGGGAPSIADIRLASTLEFLDILDYPFTGQVKGYRSAVEETLGEAYTEPAADVLGYIQYVRSQNG